MVASRIASRCVEGKVVADIRTDTDIAGVGVVLVSSWLQAERKRATIVGTCEGIFADELQTTRCLKRTWPSLSAIAVE